MSSETVECWSGYSYGQYITSTVLRGDRDRLDGSFGAIDMARSAALFMAGGFGAFMRDTLALAGKAVAAVAQGHGLVLNNVARDMLRYVSPFTSVFKSQELLITDHHGLGTRGGRPCSVRNRNIRSGP